MCLKRYSFTEGGKAIRLSTQIDIPTEIGLPHFISDDNMEEDGPIYGNFKLSLQSVVCHRGNSVDSGHYISLVKGTSTSPKLENGSKSDSDHEIDHWMRFDDLAAECITLVDINRALKDETPYLLFYQIVPIDAPGRNTEGESLPLYAPSDAHDSGISVASLNLHGHTDEMPRPSRPSLEITGPDESPRGRTPVQDGRRPSAPSSEPANQVELAIPDLESSQSSSQRASMHAKTGSQSRSQSQAGDKFSLSLSRLTRGKSKEVLPTLGNTVEAEGSSGDGSLEASATDDDRGKGFLRRDRKQEKSKSRLSKIAANASARAKAEKPDRECAVM
jgi:Ubiquitin carboxyl-terminal hydrolase